MTPAAWGALVGLLAAGGAWSLLLWAGARRPRLDARLAPYLRPHGGATAAFVPPGPRSVALLAPLREDAVRLLERVTSPRADLARRLARAGDDRSVEQLRSEQVVWGVLGLASGMVLGLALVAGRGTSPAVAALLVAVCGLLGPAARDHVLSRAVDRREARLLAELPTVAELLALAVAAGEGPLRALERVVTSTRGEMTREIGAVLAEVRAGSPLPVALDAMADRTGVVPLARFAEAIAVAVERGSPLADVLRAQADDVREASRRALMEAGGRKEVAMMVPVVFLVLPVTVVFAVFPGLLALRLDL